MPINCKVDTSEETPVAARDDQKPASPKGLDARKGSRPFRAYSDSYSD